MIEEEQVVEGEREAAGVGDYVAFRRTGETAKGSFRCADCGYGVVVNAPLPLCPMCGSMVWEEVRAVRRRPSSQRRR
jgi:rubrerythrin